MNKKGFTLIELLIVIGIIAILAAAVIVAINPGRQFEQARNATRRSHLSSVASAVYSYAVENQGNFPDCIPTAETWTADNNFDSLDGECDGIPASTVSLEDLLVPDYINQLPTDPSEDNYQIRVVNGVLQLISDSSEWDETEMIVQ